MRQTYGEVSMSRFVLASIVVIGLLLALNVNASALIASLAALIILAGAFHFILRGRFPEHFLLMLIGALLGPILFCYLVGTLMRLLHSVFGGGLSPYLVLLCLALISFLYVRWHRAQLRKQHKPELQTHERQPVNPIHDGSGGEGDQCAASDSSSGSSSED
jgi:hypothetical protein